jgi:hypothetical protein
MKRIPCAFFILLILAHPAWTQQFGGFRPGTKWKQINTDTVRIIFTEGAEEQANRIATLVHKAAADTPFALGTQLRKVNIVLHSHTTLANGYVALAPFRSEFYLIPGSDVFEFGNLPWYENLAVHEYHHVQQYNNFRNGLSRGFYYLFGEQGLALANALTIPDWFFEGDAVHTETALTQQGRGRLSLFLSGYQSLWLENRRYGWMKLRNGSLKDYVPDHYQLGYLLVNYGYLKYGEEFWKKVTRDASAFKGFFYPFQKAVRKYAGVDYKTFRNDAISFYQKKLDNVKRPDVKKMKTVSDVYFPQFISNDSLLFLRSAYNKLPAFYIRDKNGDEKIALRDIGSENWFGYRKGRIVYTAYSADPRWSLTDYSDIVVLNIADHNEKRLTRREKYFTPDLSPSADKIVTVRINDSLQTELRLLRSSDGNVIGSIRPEGGQYFSNPRFIDEDRILAGIRTPDAKMSLQSYDLSAHHWEELIPYSDHTIGQPYVHGDTIYFTANFYGNDDVFAMDLKEKKIYQLTRKYTGTYYPSAGNDSLVFSFFTSSGLQMEKVALKKALWTDVDLAALEDRSLLYPVALEQNIDSVPTRRFAAKRYRKSTGLFHFHSWAPNYSDPEFTFSVYSDNVLNTFSNELYYRYNQNENSHGLGWNASYGGFFPMINAGVEYTYNRHLPFSSGELTLDQYEARLGYNIPLDLTKGRTYKFLNFGSDFVFNHAIPTGIFKDSLRPASSTYLRHFLIWSHYLPRAVQHIYPKFGYTVFSDNRHLLDKKGYQFLETIQLFLPSFGNHSIVVTGSIQETDTSNTIFSNRFANSRGYDDYFFSRMWRLSANYHFPLAYPDLGLANIVYLQRLRANLFYDLTRVYSGNKLNTRDLRSVGAEIYFDTKWWNQQPVSFGIRVSHLLDNGFTAQDRKGANWFEFILPVNLIPR